MIDYRVTIPSTSNFEKQINNVSNRLYTLRNKNGIQVQVTNLGARIVSILTLDNKGNWADIVLGHSSIEGYEKDKMYLGCIVGRYANRIKEGRFYLHEEEYQLFINNNSNSLHGGQEGFDKQMFEGYQEGNIVTFQYTSTDMEEGYPGNLVITKTYILNDNDELILKYHAITDKATVVNLTNHTYFNLKGEGDTTILNHVLQINSNNITSIDEALVPTGIFMDISKTPFDFRIGKPIGQDIEQLSEQLLYGKGYDHNWVLNKKNGVLSFAAKLSEPTTGRFVEIRTTEPGIQFYSGNFMDGTVIGKSGKPYVYRAGLCLETQHFPDSPNHSHFPSTELNPGQEYKQTTVLKFGVE